MTKEQIKIKIENKKIEFFEKAIETQNENNSELELLEWVSALLDSMDSNIITDYNNFETIMAITTGKNKTFKELIPKGQQVHANFNYETKKFRVIDGINTDNVNNYDFNAEEFKLIFQEIF